MSNEVNLLWSQNKEKNRNKIEGLCSKWKPKDVNHKNIRNIKYKDVDIDVEVNDKNPKALSYGGVGVTNNMYEILTMNPKMMMYNKVDLIETECEIEKAMMKCRYSLMSKNVENNDQNDYEDDEESNETLDMQNKTIFLYLYLYISTKLTKYNKN